MAARMEVGKPMTKYREKDVWLQAGVRVGQPAFYMLRSWAQDLADAFGEPVWLVGSSTIVKDWRDVDVRIGLPDSKFARLTTAPKISDSPIHYPQWAALNLAVSIWGQKVTGLPIDFQFQSDRCEEAEKPDLPRAFLARPRFKPEPGNTVMQHVENTRQREGTTDQ